LGLLYASSAAFAEGVITGEDRAQVYIGVTMLEDQTGELQNETGEDVEIDFPNLLALGFEIETPFRNKDQGLEYGINAGIGVSWKGDDTEFAGKVDDEGGTAFFRIDNEMLLVEGHIGPYLRGHLGPSVDFYLGAGPALIYASHDVDDDNDDEVATPVISSNGTVILTDDSSSDFIIGYYARAGFEYDLGSGKQWGIGVRYLGGELDFNDTVGEFDLEGVQVLLTYSAWF
jgi:hypothetical protein